VAPGSETTLLGVGLFGQLLFSARFLVQWLASERAGRSVVPLAFWYLSVGGGLVLFLYAWVRRDPVFIIGQGTGLFIYVRNLHLLRRHPAQGRTARPARLAEPATSDHARER
jgi:lipid-A-disaccharide synthase-like uncharacterized protein